MRSEGFKLVQVAIGISVIMMISAAVFVVIDPARDLNESRNAKRLSDVTNILDALVKYQDDNDGQHYSSVDSITNGKYYVIGTCESGATCSAVNNESTCVDLSDIGTNYLSTVPNDPKDAGANESKYYVMKDSNGAITVGACEPEGEGDGGTGLAPKIEVVR